LLEKTVLGYISLFHKLQDKKDGEHIDKKLIHSPTKKQQQTRYNKYLELGKQEPQLSIQD
jgi:hypothetical protein